MLYAFYCGASRKECGVVVIYAPNEEWAWRILYEEYKEDGYTYEEWLKDATDTEQGWYLMEQSEYLITCDGH